MGFIKGSENIRVFFWNLTGSTYNVAQIFIKGVFVFDVLSSWYTSRTNPVNLSGRITNFHLSTISNFLVVQNHCVDMKTPLFKRILKIIFALDFKFLFFQVWTELTYTNVRIITIPHAFIRYTAQIHLIKHVEWFQPNKESKI